MDGRGKQRRQMEYTMFSPMRYLQYFERIDESLPIPAPDKAISDFNKSREDLAEYLHEPLKEVITSITFKAEADRDWCDDMKTDVNLYVTIKATRELTEDEQDDLIDWLNGQYSDGWGENGFEYSDGMFQVWWDTMPGIEFV